MKILKIIAASVLPSLYESIKKIKAAEIYVAGGDKIWADNVFDDAVLKKIIKEKLSNSGSGVDIGAADGLFIGLMSKANANEKHLAVEIQPKKVAKLKQTLNANVIVSESCLSDTEEDVSFQISVQNTGYSGLVVTKASVNIGNTEYISLKTKTVKLDTIIPKEILNIKIIKIDVEGAELKVIKGGAETLKKHKPILLFECCSHIFDNNDTPDELYAILTDMDYKIYSTSMFVNKQLNISKEYFIEAVTKGYHSFFIAE